MSDFAVAVVTLPDCLQTVCKPQPHLDSFSPYTVDLERYYQTENEDENPFICSQPRENGMRYCRSIPTRREEGLECTLDYYSYNDTTNTSCVNWNQYYTNCSAGEHNPFKGAINFDNIGYAWIAIFQVSPVCKLSQSGQRPDCAPQHVPRGRVITLLGAILHQQAFIQQCTGAQNVRGTI